MSTTEDTTLSEPTITVIDIAETDDECDMGKGMEVETSTKGTAQQQQNGIEANSTISKRVLSEDQPYVSCSPEDIASINNNIPEIPEGNNKVNIIFVPCSPEVPPVSHNSNSTNIPVVPSKKKRYIDENDSDGKGGVDKEGSKENSMIPEKKKVKRKKIVPSNSSSTTDDSSNCSICFESWKSTGSHRVCCLKCGHLFGKSCIEKWLKEKRSCPSCSAKARTSDIRVLFVSKVLAIDPVEMDRVKQELAAVQKQLTDQTKMYEMLKRKYDRVKAQLDQSKFLSNQRPTISYVNSTNSGFFGCGPNNLTTPNLFPTTNTTTTTTTTTTATPPPTPPSYIPPLNNNLKYPTNISPVSNNNNKYNNNGSNNSPNSSNNNNSTANSPPITIPSYIPPSKPPSITNSNTKNNNQTNLYSSSNPNIKTPTPPLNTYFQPEKSTNTTPSKYVNNGGYLNSGSINNTTKPSFDNHNNNSFLTPVKNSFTPNKATSTMPKTSSSQSSMPNRKGPNSPTGLYALNHTIPTQGVILVSCSTGENRCGIMKVSGLDPGNTDMIPCVHTKQIRDIKVYPSSQQPLAITVGLDKFLKVVHVSNKNVVQEYPLEAPGWACAFDRAEPHLLYCGLVNGTVSVYDMRQTKGHLTQMIPPQKMPIHSLCYMDSPENSESAQSGVLCGAVNGIYFFEKNGFNYKPGLVPLEGNCTSVYYNTATKTCLASFRSSPTYSKASHTIFRHEGQGSITALRTLHTSSPQQLLSRSVVFKRPFQSQQESGGLKIGPSLIVAAGDEETREVVLWDVNNGSVLQKLPQNGLSLDVKHFTHENVNFLVSLTESSLNVFHAVT